MYARPICVLILILLPFSAAVGQIGHETNLWSWTVAAEHHHAIVKVSLAGAEGTGTIIQVDREKPLHDGYEGYCLTAYHVVEKDNGRRKIEVRYRNGRGSQRCKVVSFDAELDVAILWVWVPSDIEPASLAKEQARYGDPLEFAGLGGGSEPADSLRSFTASASAPTKTETIYADVPLLPGDSGGPVFNLAKEVVGVISGGWFWWDGGVVTDAGFPIIATWPARAANVVVVHQLLDEL